MFPSQEATAWDLALLRAEAAAAIYAAYLLEHGQFRVGLRMEAGKHQHDEPMGCQQLKWMLAAWQNERPRRELQDNHVRTLVASSLEVDPDVMKFGLFLMKNS